ncbi:DUF1176 domain-containing protein [Aquabacter sp. CN5-332]|uniref:DUF1176 domain-containing protein n=1 Tax=Aquabacter sp. CN5-332 TaxID=3156608 RepID=UPI0032B3C43E
MRYFRLIRSFPRAAFVLAALAGPASADDAPTKVPELKKFRDWVVGCDNIRRCTAIGFAPRQFEGYIVVKRDAAAEAEVQVSLVARGDAKIEGPAVMSIQVDGDKVPGMSKAAWPVLLDDTDTEKKTGRIEIKDRDAAILLRLLHDAKVLGLTVTGKGQDPFDSLISLGGAAAALLYIDDSQQRVGTVTAIVNPGTAPASAIPAAPPMPQLKSVVMREVKDPPSALPKGVMKPPADNCEDPPSPDVIRLSPQLELWGVCEFKNSHNYSARYWIVGEGTAKEASLVVPGRQNEGGGPSVLINLDLTRDGRLLESFVKGRGLSDCGSDAAWAWTGTEFELAYFAEMSECMGVSADDWPVLYTTRWK